MRKIKYQCGHYAKSKFGQCQKNTIPAEWIEAEVIEYTKLLVRNKQFAEDIQGQLVHKTDVSEIDCKFRFIGSPIPLATDQCFRL